MKTRLPEKFLKSNSSIIYRKLIADFSEDLYLKKQSDLLGQHVLKKISTVKASPGASDKGQSKKPKSGHILELLIAEMLIMHNVTPFFTQAQMWKVPSSILDFLLFNEDTPVILSCKMSMGDRWRQTAVEGFLLKNVYRKGKCFLLCGKEADVRKRNEDIKEGRAFGIDLCYTVGSKEMKIFLVDLSKNYNFSTPEKIDPIVKFSKKVEKV